MAFSRAQGLLQHRHKWRELAISLLALVLRGVSPGALSHFLTVFLANPVFLQISPSESCTRHFMRLTLPIMSMVITSYIPAEKFSRAVEHPCQFWIGIRPFRLSVFGRRQQTSSQCSAAIAADYALPHLQPLRERLPGLRWAMAFATDEGERPLSDWQGVEDWAARAPTDVPDLPLLTTDPDSALELIFTSGTTGDPKGIVMTHRRYCQTEPS